MTVVRKEIRNRLEDGLAARVAGCHTCGTMKASLVLIGLLLAACGSSTQPPVAAPNSRPKVAEITEPKPPPVGALWREDVVAAVDRGLGHFLQHVDVEPRLEYGEFRGWTITELRPKGFWAGVDLRPGDVVTSINSMPIERDVQAFAAFEALKTAQQLSVTYQRGSETRTLSFKILSKAAPGQNPAPVSLNLQH